MKPGLIESNPAVLLGKPVIKGTRISVELVLERLSAGDSEDSILESYPHLTKKQIRAALAYAKEVLQKEQSHLKAASSQ